MGFRSFEVTWKFPGSTVVFITQDMISRGKRHDSYSFFPWVKFHFFRTHECKWFEITTFRAWFCKCWVYSALQKLFKRTEGTLASENIAETERKACEIWFLGGLLGSFGNFLESPKTFWNKGICVDCQNPQINFRDKRVAVKWRSMCSKKTTVL